MGCVTHYGSCYNGLLGALYGFMDCVVTMEEDFLCTG